MSAKFPRDWEQGHFLAGSLEVFENVTLLLVYRLNKTEYGLESFPGFQWISFSGEYEPPHYKTNKITCAPSEDSDQPGLKPSLISLRCLQEENLGP